MTSPNYDHALSLNLGFRPTTTPNPRLPPPDSDVNLSLSLSLITAVNANTNKSPPPPPQIRHVASPRSAVSSLSLSNCSAKRSRDPPAPTASVTVSEEVDRNHSSTKSDDEDEELVGAHSNVRKKLRLNKDQSALLEDSFKLHSTLNPKQKSALAKQLNLRPRQVEVWFQNRRARTKFKQTEVDCELLKKWCESLTNENRRLQKEIQELRSVKVAAQPPFYMQLPAATLTMCPSCERITGSTTASATEGGQVRRR